MRWDFSYSKTLVFQITLWIQQKEKKKILFQNSSKCITSIDLKVVHQFCSHHSFFNDLNMFKKFNVVQVLTFYYYAIF